MSFKNTILLGLASLFLCISPSYSQDSYGGAPLGLTIDWKKEKGSALIPAVSPQAYKAYEENHGAPLYALPIAFEQKIEDRIHWTNVDDELVGLLSLKMSDAAGAAILLGDFELPFGARLFIYEHEGKEIIGAYTSMNNNSSKNFLTEIISGTDIVVEVVLPINSKKQFPFSIEKFYKVLDDRNVSYSSAAIDTGFNASYECHQNINCPLGADVRDEQKGVVRVMMVLEEGLGWCTGSLMNNSNEDRMPLVLSGFHCQDSYTPLYNLWRFDFNFEAAGCDNPGTAPSRQSIVGCTQVAGRQATDFILFKLNESVPASFDVHYNGWDRRDDYEPVPTTFIHHPAGDIKKVCNDKDDLTIWASSTNWDNDTRTPANSHFRLNLEDGTHQPGSSGGPLFDSEGRVVGQLHGGNTDTSQCMLTRAYFGRLSQSWTGESEGENLDIWLDPMGSGIAQLDGLGAADTNMNTVTIAGEIVTADGKPLVNVSLDIIGEGNALRTSLSDAGGNYSFQNMADNKNYTITPTKNSNPNNGVSASDLVLITNHIIGTNPFADIFKTLAGDVNESGSVSGADIVQIQNLILGLKNEYSSGISWGFLPKSLTVDPKNFNQEELKITAYKLGDVNFSANPNN